MLSGYSESKEKTKSQKDAVLFIKQKLDSAKWFIEAIKQNRESYDFIDSSMKLDKDVSAAFMKYSMI